MNTDAKLSAMLGEQMKLRPVDPLLIRQALVIAIQAIEDVDYPRRGAWDKRRAEFGELLERLVGDDIAFETYIKHGGLRE